MNKKYNRLIQEKSPYLLQHAENPVDWHPWGEEAFQRARKEDKPIFLSIGYSTCHWCHVMEHESFEDPEVARLLNETFICIKVDREERPDIDAIYMTVCQMMTGTGGWPLTILMTPDKKPFFAATYIPKMARFGRPGLMELIPKIRNLWQNQRMEILQSADKVTTYLQKAQKVIEGEEPENSSLSQAYSEFKKNFDEKFGGFGQAPKFPSPHSLLFLLRYWKQTGEEDALEMVQKTLIQMRLGGIFDQVGFGFHRYSTDEKWLVPHFEKMLYDQAMLILAYAEAFQATGNPFFEETVREIASYVLRDLTSQEGGFYSAEDADSEGEEGKFYLWTEEEIKHVLSVPEAEFAIRVFNIKPEGNFVEEASRQRNGKNILHLSASAEELARQFGMSLSEFRELYEKVRQKLFAVRENRVHPFKDDKILTDWNGLMIAALSKAAQITGEENYVQAARKSIQFILTHLKQENRLFHRYREGEVDILAFLDDYAFLIWGLIEFYETTFESSYLQEAISLLETTIEKFWDETQGGFYFTSTDNEELLVRKKEFYDGAVPAGNSVMMLNLLRLGRITGDSELEKKAERIARLYAPLVNEYPLGYTMFLSALQFAFGPTHEIVIVGDPEKIDTRQMIETIHRHFLPNKVVLLKPLKDADHITGIAPFLGSMQAIEKKATAYVCVNQACELPTTDVGQMLALLEKK